MIPKLELLARRARRVLVVGLIVALTLAGVGSPVGAGEPKPLATEPGQVVVKLAPGFDVDDFNARWGTEVIDPVLASHGIYLLSVPVDTTEKEKDQEKQTKDLAKEMAKDDGVVYAEQNFVTDVAEEERFHVWPGQEIQLLPPGEVAWTEQPVVAALGLDAVHGVASGAGVTVAVLDTGVDLDHPLLAGRIVGGYDYIDDDDLADDVGNGSDDDGDGSVDEAVGHGTHVAGIVSLVAPGAAIWSARVLGSDGQGNVFVVAEAIHDAIIAGADVINLSFGIDRKVESKVLGDALEEAKKAGVLVVAAAGNDGAGSKHYPAADKDVLGVAALDPSGDRLAGFSSHGKWATVAAPGQQIISTVPGGGFAIWSGTSMAAPFVTGQAALLLQVDPEAKLNDVRKAIADSADKLESGPKVDKGGIRILDSLVRFGVEPPDETTDFVSDLLGV